MIEINDGGDVEVIVKVKTSQCVADDLPLLIQKILLDAKKVKKERDCGCKKKDA